jgi:hypothetical protein
MPILPGSSAPDFEPWTMQVFPGDYLNSAGAEALLIRGMTHRLHKEACNFAMISQCIEVRVTILGVSPIP